MSPSQFPHLAACALEDYRPPITAAVSSSLSLWTLVGAQYRPLCANQALATETKVILDLLRGNGSSLSLCLSMSMGPRTSLRTHPPIPALLGPAHYQAHNQGWVCYGDQICVIKTQALSSNLGS